MGIFRKHKAKDFTREEAQRKERDSLAELIAVASKDGDGKSLSDDRITEIRRCATEWAEWRELLARKEGDNESDTW